MSNVLIGKGCAQSDPYGRPLQRSSHRHSLLSTGHPGRTPPFFDGGASEYKRTLDTRDPDEARQRYHPHAVVYEQKLAAARRTRASHHLRSARAMVDDFLDGQPDEDLRGVAQKLAALELGAFDHANGLTNDAPGARYDFGISPGLDDLRDHASRITMLSAVPDLLPLSWQAYGTDGIGTKPSFP